MNKLSLALLWETYVPVLLPLLSCNDVPSDLLWFLREYITFDPANFEGYTTEVIFQSFKRHLMTITYRVSTPNGGFGECIFLVTCSKFCALVYGVYGIFDAELCTTSWAPVLTNRQFKECMFTYM